MANQPTAKPSFEPSDVSAGLPRLSDDEMQRAVADWRAKYGSYDQETAQLLEAKMVAAFIADGYAVPEMTADDRLKILRQRQFLSAKGK